MRHEIKCSVCGHTSWHPGWEEYDTNAAGLDDNNALDDACEHIQQGGSYEITDTAYDDDVFEDF